MVAQKKNKPRQWGIAILSAHIKLGDAGLDLAERVVYAYIYSFCDHHFCFAKNPAIAKYLHAKENTIARCIKNLDKAGLLYIENRGSKSRRIYAKTHPRVKAWLDGEQARKVATTNKHSKLHNKRSEQASILASTPHESGQLHPTNLATTNKYTIKDTIKQSEPPALANNGQQPDSLKTKDGRLAREHLKRKVVENMQGFGKGKVRTGLSPEELNRRKQEARRQLGVGV